MLMTLSTSRCYRQVALAPRPSSDGEFGTSATCSSLHTGLISITDVHAVLAAVGLELPHQDIGRRRLARAYDGVQFNKEE